MFNLERHERAVIIFLVFTLLIGLGVRAFQKSRQAVKVRVARFSMEKEGIGNLTDLIGDARR